MSNRRKFLQSIGSIGIGSSILGLGQKEIGSVLHKDAEDNDGISKESTTVTILQTTDVHCQIHPHDELFWENDQPVFRKTGGYAKMATLIKKLRRDNPNSYLIDSGDMFQGSALSVKTIGKAYVPVLNALGYDLYLPGNWEVVYGKKNMQQLLGALHSPKICANMYHDFGDGKKGELIFPPYQTWTVEGAKIGFLGYTDHLVPQRQSPVYSKGIIYTKPEENLAYYVDVLKNQEQCSFICIVAHLGLSQQIALANMVECKGIDYILGGDTHERVRKPIQCKYAKVVEPGAFGSFIGKLDLVIENGKVISDNYSLLEVKSDKLKTDKNIQKLLDSSEAIYKAEIDQIIGYSTIPLYRYFVVENPIDTLIVDALKWKFNDIEIALSNGFRFCPPRTTRDATGNVPITIGFLYDMLPIDSTVRTAQVTGKQLREWLEKELNNVFAKEASKRFGGWVVKFKGMEVSFNAFGEFNNRIQSITVNKENLDDNKIYSILACEREGDPEDVLCRIKGVKNAKNTSHTLYSVIKEYLKEYSLVTPMPHHSAIILDAPETLLSQVTGVDYKFI
jgi:sulfur-oxidizing protein SoxB